MSITYNVWIEKCVYGTKTGIMNCYYCPYKTQCLIYRQKKW